MKNKIIYAMFIVVSLVLLLNSNYCTHQKTTDCETIKRDTVYISTPSKENTFKRDTFKPVYVHKYTDTSGYYKKLFKRLKIDYDKTADSLISVRKLLQALQNRKYQEKFEDSILEATANIYTTGYLDSLNISYKTKPQKAKVIVDSVFVKTKPKYSIYAHFSATAKGRFNGGTTSIGLGYQSENGFIYSIHYTSDETASAKIAIPLFTKY